MADEAEQATVKRSPLACLMAWVGPGASSTFDASCARRALPAKRSSSIAGETYLNVRLKGRLPSTRRARRNPERSLSRTSHICFGPFALAVREATVGQKTATRRGDQIRVEADVHGVFTPRAARERGVIFYAASSGMPSTPNFIQAISSPTVSTFHPGIDGVNIARFVFPQALGKAAATYFFSPWGRTASFR